MKWREIEARIKRLEALSMGLGRESSLIEKDQYPLHFSERSEYLTAIRKMINGTEKARIALVRAKHRNEAAARGAPGT